MNGKGNGELSFQLRENRSGVANDVRDDGGRKEERMGLSSCLYNPVGVVMFVSSFDLEWEGLSDRRSALACPGPEGQISTLVVLRAIYRQLYA